MIKLIDELIENRRATHASRGNYLEVFDPERLLFLQLSLLVMIICCTAFYPFLMLSKWEEIYYIHI